MIVIKIEQARDDRFFWKLVSGTEILGTSHEFWYLESTAVAEAIKARAAMLQNPWILDTAGIRR